MKDLITYIGNTYPTVILGFCIAGAVYFILKHLNQRYPELREQFSLWLIDDVNAPNFLAMASDGLSSIYGDRYFSWRTLKRVSITSCLCFMFVFLSVGTTYEEFYTILANFDDWTGSVALIGVPLVIILLFLIGAIINIPIDIVSYTQTRFLINRSKSIKNYFLIALVIVFDFALSALIPILLTLIYMSAFHAFRGGDVLWFLQSEHAIRDTISLYYQDFTGIAPSYSEGGRAGVVQLTVALTTVFWSFVFLVIFMFAILGRSVYSGRVALQSLFRWHDHDFILKQPFVFVGEYAAVIIVLLSFAVAFAIQPT